MAKTRWLLLVLTLIGWSSVANADVPAHCVVKLVPTPETYDRAGAATAVDRGCYDSYADAVKVGTSGATVLPAHMTPSDLTQAILDVSSRPRGGSVLIGTEWVETGWTGASQSYFAPSACSGGDVWEVSSLGSWDNDFESGKGFGGCDTNKKFRQTGFGGDVRTCTPNCWGYGDLNNDVSSLRWRP